MASCGLHAAARAEAIFRRDSVRIRRWRDDGTLKKVFELCAAPGTGTELSMDSTSIKASAQAGRGIRKRAKIRHQAASAKHAEV